MAEQTRESSATCIILNRAPIQIREERYCGMILSEKLQLICGEQTGMGVFCKANEEEEHIPEQ